MNKPNDKLDPVQILWDARDKCLDDDKTAMFLLSAISRLTLREFNEELKPPEKETRHFWWGFQGKSQWSFFMCGWEYRRNGQTVHADIIFRTHFHLRKWGIQTQSQWAKESK